MVDTAGESKSNKAEGNDELLRGEDLDGDDDAARDSDDGTGSNSKSGSLDGGDVQGNVIKDDAPTPAAADGGGSSSGKGKSVAVERQHVPHYWMERERKRRKKMKNLYNTWHSLLPRFPQKVSIYGCHDLHTVQP
jgi:hypothetical protein